MKDVSKQGFIRSCLAICLATACTLHLCFAAPKPNILYILADDLGYADLGVHGCKQYKTPNIDSIFEGGVRFEQGYVSNSVCAPSRAGLLTGRFGSRFGFEANLPHKLSSKPGSTIGLDPKEKTIADVLKPAGYSSYCLGKWHLGDNPDLFHPNKRGFDHFFGLMGGSRSYFKIEFDPIKSLQHNGEFIEEQDGMYMTDLLTDKAIEFIEAESRSETPFFMYLSYTAPHGPMDAKEEYLERLQHIKSEKRRAYAGMMLSLDDNVGRVLDRLDELGLKENTLIVFMSDNGGPVAHNGSWNGSLRGKIGTLFEGGVRVPFGIQWQGQIPAAQVQDEKVISVDLLPTFVKMAGLSLDGIKTDGVDLMPLLKNEVESLGERSFYWRRGQTTQVGMIEGKYKYMQNRNKSVDYLYNLEEDRSEKENLAQSRPELLSRMKSQYKKWEQGVPKPAFASGFKAKKNKGH
jgi:arylsulfatase A-like enzyme